jgi:membrane associated rhomboid family serine protease
MRTGPEEVSARPLPAVVIAFSLLCSAAFLHALTLDAAGLADWFDRWGLVPRALLRELREVGLGWRVLTPLSAAGLHASFLHLVGNLFYLWLFGEALELLMGGLRFALLLLLCALAAALAHVVAEPTSFVPAIGASGLVSGLLGAYLPLRRRTPLGPRWHPGGVSPLVFLALWGAFVLLGAWSGAAGLASWAHLGGFLAGAALAGLLAPEEAPLQRV